jgi:hypothetical protein
MNGGRHLSQDDLALFALQLLEGEELEQALDHLELCEDCRHDVARFQGDLAGYALAGSEVHTPPAAAREKLMQAVAKEKKSVPERSVAPLRRSSAAVPVAQIPLSAYAAPEAEEPAPVHDGEIFLAARGRRLLDADVPEEDTFHRTPRRGANPVLAALGWTGWAVAAGLAVAAGMQYRDRQTVQSEYTAQNAALARANSSLDEAEAALHTMSDAGAMQVSLHVPPATGAPPAEPEGHASYDARTGALVFIGDHLPALPQGKTYELWLLPPDKSAAPVPAGMFKPDARGVASVMMPDIPKGLPAQGFGVTVENDGGSQKPTLPIVMVGL